MGKPATTEVGDKVELKPETTLAYDMHVASLDFTVERIQREEQHFVWAEACPERIAQLRKGTQNSIPGNDQFR